MIKRRQLRQAAKINPEGVKRLACFLRLNIKDMSARQVANLVAWRLKNTIEVNTYVHTLQNKL